MLKKTENISFPEELNIETVDPKKTSSILWGWIVSYNVNDLQ